MTTIEIPVTLSGSIVTAEDATQRNFINLIADIEPVQDLHGYDSPWPAGGGKNIFPITLAQMKTLNTAGTWTGDSYARNGVTFTFTTKDGYITEIKANGTVSGNFNLILTTTEVHNEYVGKILNGCPSGGGGSSYNVTGYNLTDNEGLGVYDTGSGMTIPSSITDKQFRLYIFFLSGYNCQNVIFRLMIRDASVTDATFAPYSNICPISGHSECNIFHEVEYDAGANPVITIDLDGTRYGETLNVLTGELAVNRKMVDMGDYNWTYVSDVSQPYFTYNFNDSDTTYTTTKSDGLLCSMYPFKQITSSNTNEGFCFSGTYCRVRDKRYTDAATFKTAVSGTQLVYKLATPVVVSLTPAQMQALVGTNVVWSDTGNTLLTYYRSVEMALSTMYPAKNGSPKTTLSADITASATSMALDDTSVLPPAPNLAVLGEEANAEIVLYNDVTGNIVSGMVRGINGTTASAWTAGTAVARNYTSYDHDTIINNILSLDEDKANVSDEIMYFASQSCSAVTSAEIFRITNAAITTDTVVLECSFSKPSAIISAVAWQSYNGYIAFTGTCIDGTCTANVTIGLKGN